MSAKSPPTFCSGSCHAPISMPISLSGAVQLFKRNVNLVAERPADLLTKTSPNSP